MAQPLGRGQHTVLRDLRTETLLERKRRTDRGGNMLTPYTTDLLDRCNTGCRGTWRRFRELQPQRDPERYAPVARYAPRLRHAPRPRGRTPATTTTSSLAERDRAAAPRLDPAPGDLAGPATAGAAHGAGGRARRCHCARPRLCPAGVPAAGTTAGSLAGPSGGLLLRTLAAVCKGPA